MPVTIPTVRVMEGLRYSLAVIDVSATMDFMASFVRIKVPTRTAQRPLPPPPPLQQPDRLPLGPLLRQLRK